MTRPPRREKGFALLVIFLIAAAVAFTMYQELPRAAFESARDKEQLLMDRGNQYKRAIQVYYAVNKRYPAELKDLENTNDKRFLRRRYKDPMTGEDEWRLVHTNGSFLTDSLVQKPPAQNANSGLPGAGQTPGGGPLGANTLNTAPAAATTPADANAAAFSVTTAPQQNAAAQRRPSDRGFPTGPGFPQNPNQAAGNPFGANPANFNPDDPRTWPAITLAQPNGPNGQPNGQLNGQPTGQLNGQAGQPQLNGQTGQVGARAGQPFPGQQGQFQPQGQAGPGQFGLAGSNPRPVSNGLFPAIAPNGDQSPAQVSINQDGQLTPQVNQFVPPPQAGQQPFNGVPPFGGSPIGFNPQQAAPFQRPNVVGAQPNPPALGAPSGNAALDAINNQLFRPNQAPATGPTGSPGIAGVASKFKGPSIKAYRERTKYQEWEFVYEPITNQPGQPGVAGQGQNGLGQNGMGPNGGPPGLGQTPAGGQPNPFSQPNPFAPQTPTR